MKKDVCLMCIVCFFLGYFIADVVSKCGFGAEHLTKHNDKKHLTKHSAKKHLTKHRSKKHLTKHNDKKHLTEYTKLLKKNGIKPSGRYMDPYDCKRPRRLRV